MTHIAKSDLDIAQDLRELANRLVDAANDLTYYGGLRAEWHTHSRQLIGVSAYLLDWANAIQAEHRACTRPPPSDV